MRTILIIDDDEICRAPAADMLRRADWHVLEAPDGEQGLELALRHRPDVILCDLLMPRGNGFHVCRTVKEANELRHTKVIVCTGRDYAADRKSAEEAGADEYLVKPFDLHRLEQALSRVTPAPPPRLRRRDMSGQVNGSHSGTVIRFWGVRGSIPTPGPSTVFFGGNTSCVELRSDGEILVLDAGSGIRPLGQALAQEFGERPINLTLLITHTHWDHIQGFPFFLPAYEAKNRLRILGYEGASAGLSGTLAGQMESPYFPIALNQMPGNITIEELKEMAFEVGPVQAKACFTNHPGVCVGYRFETNCGSIVYMPDNETFGRAADRSGAAPSIIGSQIAEFIAGADVLICDAQYSAEEYRAHVGWGHGCLDEVVRVAIASRVKRLFLFHYDPAHDDAFISGMIAHARRMALEAGSSLQIDAAREGDELVMEVAEREAADAAV